MFREKLQRFVDPVEGGVAGLLMGFDGIPIESYARAGSTIDINTVGMEFSFVLSQVRKAAEILQVGGVREITIKAERLVVIMQVLSEEYFIALALEPEGNFGKGRYLMRTVGPKMAAEL
jgi:predicted regulator of Ras-like GTPase activity (Roadblock/LC7/MglB family)